MTATTTRTWEAVIGLEVHVELSTATKLFCSCKNEFGAEPNTNICPVCLGLPGSLPVLGERAVEFALRVGEALQCTVPDGSLEVGGTRIGIERAHMEEDTGKTIHVGGGGRIHEADHSLVDYNRAGIPLMEVVSRPDIRSAEQARAYVNELRGVLQAIGVSDVKMEEGAFRSDANVSLRPAGASELGTKVEVKNMNSIRSLGRALEYEIERQSALLDAGERVVQETRHWDEEAGVTQTMRTKEGADDYRYFPEPDLVPVAPDGSMHERVRAGMPELPAAWRARLAAEWAIGEHEARVLVGTPGLAEYAAAAVTALRTGTAKDVVNWCTGELLGYLHETGLAPDALSLTPAGLAELVDLVADGTLSRNLGKDVLAECLREAKRPKQVVEERGLAQVSDESELASVVDEIIAAHPDVVADYRAGDDKTRKKKRGFLMGEAMKATKGQGNPQLLNRLLDERLAQLTDACA